MCSRGPCALAPGVYSEKPHQCDAVVRYCTRKIGVLSAANGSPNDT
jgi:hypothetical protein